MRTGKSHLIEVVEPKDIKIQDVSVVSRKVFHDERGFLIETFAKSKEETTSVYSYCSLTRPGFARDIDRFHYHLQQEDRFTVVLGRMWVVLFDARKDSPTFENLQVVELVGGNVDLKDRVSLPCATITIPRIVYHGIMNPGPSVAMIVNHPTQEYTVEDEGRIVFSQVKINSLGEGYFSWDKVKER